MFAPDVWIEMGKDTRQRVEKVREQRCSLSLCTNVLSSSCFCQRYMCDSRASQEATAVLTHLRESDVNSGSGGNPMLGNADSGDEAGHRQSYEKLCKQAARKETTRMVSLFKDHPTMKVRLLHLWGQCGLFLVLFLKRFNYTHHLCCIRSHLQLKVLRTYGVQLPVLARIVCKQHGLQVTTV